MDNIEPQIDEDLEENATQIAEDQDKLVYAYNDKIRIMVDPRCYMLVIDGKQSYYCTLAGAFRGLSNHLMRGKFLATHADFKRDLDNITALLREHFDEIDRHMNLCPKTPKPVECRRTKENVKKV